METQGRDTPRNILPTKLVTHIFILCIMNQRYTELGWNMNVIFCIVCYIMLIK